MQDNLVVARLLCEFNLIYKMQLTALKLKAVWLIGVKSFGKQHNLQTKPYWRKQEM